MVLDVARRIADAFPDADVRVPVSGPFSLATNLLGLESLLAETLTAPDAVTEALNRLAENQIAFCRAIVASGLDVAFFESAAAPPLISPTTFREVELPALRRAIAGAAEVAGHPVPCIVGGDTTPILDAILGTGSGYVICPAETDQAHFMAQMASHTAVMVRINMRPEAIVSTDLSAVYREADRVLALAAGRELACIGTGALPYEAEPDIVLKVGEYVRQR